MAHQLLKCFGFLRCNENELGFINVFASVLLLPNEEFDLFNKSYAVHLRHHELCKDVTDKLVLAGKLAVLLNCFIASSQENAVFGKAQFSKCSLGLVAACLSVVCDDDIPKSRLIHWLIDHFLNRGTV